MGGYRLTDRVIRYLFEPVAFGALLALLVIFIVMADISGSPLTPRLNKVEARLDVLEGK